MTIITVDPVDPSNGVVQESDQEELRRPLYSSVEGWVSGYFAPMFLHRVAGNPRVRWCPSWWDHAEAIVRLTVLWNAWEGARWEPAAKPGWWLMLDHHLPILLSTDGPFRLCRHGEDARSVRHESAKVPAVVPAPDGWWE